MTTTPRTVRRELPVLSNPAPARSAVAGTGPRIGLITLGCDKNTVDSERILGRLVGAGARVSGDVAGADVVVVNTCGFIEMAKEESIEAILDAVRLKEDGRTRAVVAMGCLVQRYKAELEAELPDVDLFLGLTEADRLLPELRARGLLDEDEGPVPTMERPLRVLTTATSHASHLKISEGCDHACAFCAIPLMRGKHRSTPIETLVAEARELEAAGVVELSLVSQDTTWYGRDWARGGHAAGGAGEFFIGKPFPGMAVVTGGAGRGAAAAEAARRTADGVLDGVLGGVSDGAPVRAGGGRAADGRRRPGSRAGGMAARGTPVRPSAPPPGVTRHGALPALLRALLDETSIPWFRLFYMYPSGIRPELVEMIAGEDRIVPYLDMPIQHGADAVLARMRRPERRATIRERVRWLREAIPDVTLRTTVIVGFPGETDDDFEALLDLLEEIRFDRVGAFAYSVEEGTPAAKMADPVPASVVRQRLERLHDVQRAISLERNEAWIGRTVTVLVDRDDGAGRAVGRTAGQAYEIDGVVRLEAAEGEPGASDSPDAPDAAGRDAPRGAGAEARPAVGAGVRPGRFVRARITDADEDDLTGRVVADD